MKDDAEKMQAAVAYQQHRYMQTARDSQRAFIAKHITAKTFRDWMESARLELIDRVADIRSHYDDHGDE